MTATAILSPVASKTCTKCGEVKTIEDFHVRACHSSGRAAACKCCIEAHKKAKRLIDNAEWYEARKLAEEDKANGIRICLSCNEKKPLNEFSGKRESHNAHCKECCKAKRLEKSLAINPDLVEKIALNAAGLKKCSLCSTISPSTSEFFYSCNGVLNSHCVLCAKKKSSSYRKENKELVKAQLKSWGDKNKEYVAKKSKQYREDNSDTLIPKMRIWYQNNKQRVISGNGRRSKERAKTDPVFAMTCRVRSFVGYAFRLAGYTKRSRTHEILGCDWGFFKSHIERQFLKGMTWENKSTWHIDHIQPLATAKTEHDVIALNHFTNLRPMWAKDNMAKSDKITHLI